MPYSQKLFDTRILEAVCDSKARRVLDVGAGAGKFGRLLRMQAQSWVHLEAVEIHLPYVEEFALTDIYNVVHVENIIGYFDRHHHSIYDAIIAGDVLQSLCKSDGLDCLHEWICRARRVYVVVPVTFSQIPEGRRNEHFRSWWDESDFRYWKGNVVVERLKDGPFEGEYMLYADLVGGLNDNSRDTSI